MDSDKKNPRLLSLSWNEPRWTPLEHDPKHYRPQIKGDAPRRLRVGELKRIFKTYIEKDDILSAKKTTSRVRNNLKSRTKDEVEPVNMVAAAFVPIRSYTPLQGESHPGHIAIFSNNNQTRKTAITAIESMALRTICTFPVKKLQCTFIDPVDIGSNFPFNGKLPSLIIGERIYTSSSGIREQLQLFSSHVEKVIQRLGKDYESIEEFNQANSVVAEAYRYLFITDFPNGFDNNSREALESILRNGARAGVYVVIHVDEVIEKPRDFSYKTFSHHTTSLLPTGNHIKENPLFTTSVINKAFNILLDKPPSKEQFNQLTNLFTKTFKELKTQTLSFRDFYPSVHSAWSKEYDNRQQIRTPIGLVGAEGKLEFWLGEDEDDEGKPINVSQGLLAGKPGAGKSYTLHAIILGLAMRYAPDELEMYLLDYKEGVEFQIYVNPEPLKIETEEESDDKALPHAKMISIESDREFGLNVLKYIRQQITERSEKFKEVGAEKIKAYRDITGEKLPRIFIVIDEFQVLFEDNDSIMREINDVFDPILRKGRSYGVHLLLASQTPSVPNMNRFFSTLIELRMVQQMDKSLASSVLSEGNSDAVSLLDSPGKIIYNDRLGTKDYNQIGQIADVSKEERINALKYIQTIFHKKNFKRTKHLTVFRGSEPAKLKHNIQLNKLFDFTRWLSSKELKEFIDEKDWKAQETPGIAWLGEAMRLGNHTLAIFRRRPRNNMILIGTSEETIFGLLGGLLLSLVNCYEPQQVRFHIINLSPDEDTEWTQMPIMFRDAFQSYFSVFIGKRSLDSESDILKGETLLRQTFDEFKNRKQQRKENPDELNFGASLFLVYAVGGLNLAPNLIPIEGRRGEKPSEDAEKLLELISKGSELGIHVILWLNNMTTLNTLSGDSSRSWLNHFGLRVALKMSLEDSRLLLGETYKFHPTFPVAYFWDKANAAEMPEKFKPYTVPSAEEVFDYSNKLIKRIIE
ncbi:cell division FtsK/SpoIIIE [[Leptolyngbya] sp. PCC 7376]|uniref:FtsK/SpoIIIE domain-containing protein n=1 Tax=[Leptolyngbya] sp. PCC 7376 TaxID=111781 RepID=UPI00029F3E65|nr:FtsK/SpoIIIE domain-containing protein [[Leptolyngbya] sp. PCC 7376]AFY38209.1 cell division FtsK/SpoIIIE [[Leptolyngbya] sp. PCC 7376]